jgi:hypothetical protein
MAKPKPAVKPEPRPARSFTLTTGWAAVLLALLTVLFFHEVSLGGKTFVAPDSVAPAGFVRVGELSLWKDHVYPLWNPFVFIGMPSFGSGAYNPLIYPPDWPLALLNRAIPLPDMTWLLLYYFLGGLFFFLLAREWGARAEGALLGAVAFVFAPNLVAVGAHGHGSQLVDSAYLPLMVLLAARWLRRGRLGDLGLLALAGGFQFLRGHVQICFYTWLAVAIYGGIEVLAALRRPAELPGTLARALGLGVGAGLAFGVAGFYTLPLRDYAQYSIRGGSDAIGGVGMAYATSWSMGPWELPAIVIPNFVGFGGATYWGSMPFTDYPNAFMGIVAVLLALPALALRGRAQVFALALGAFALVVSFGHHFPLYGFLYEHLPQFKKFRIPVMILILFQLAVALGAAWGWSTVLDRGAAKRSGGAGERLLLAGGALLALAGLVVAVGGEGLRGAYVSFALAHKQPYSADLAASAFAAFSADMGKVVLVGLAVVALGWLAWRGRLGATIASVAMLGLLMFDLWPVSRQVMEPVIGDPVQRTLEQGRDDVVDFLERQGGWGSFRVVEEQGNRLAGFGIGALNGYHAAKPRLYQDLADANVINSPTWLRLLNVRYFVFPRPLDPQQRPPFFREAYTGSGAVYENLLALPRVTIVGAYGLVPDSGRAAIDSVSAGTHDPRDITWLAKAPGVALGPVAGATDTVTHYGLHDVAIDVNTPGAAIVRLADLWYPDWKATVDGRPVEILRADHALRAVVVPAGRHTVVFRYASASVAQGLTLSLVSGAIACMMLIAGALARRRSSPGTVVPAAPGAA